MRHTILVAAMAAAFIVPSVARADADIKLPAKVMEDLKTAKKATQCVDAEELEERERFCEKDNPLRGPYDDCKRLVREAVATCKKEARLRKARWLKKQRASNPLDANDSNDAGGTAEQEPEPEVQTPKTAPINSKVVHETIVKYEPITMKNLPKEIQSLPGMVTVAVVLSVVNILLLLSLLVLAILIYRNTQATTEAKPTTPQVTRTTAGGTEVIHRDKLKP